jgi:hypothetical protein
MNSDCGAGTILVLSAHEDRAADAVIGELQERAASFVRMDTGDFPIRSQLGATFSPDDFQGWLRSGDVRSDYGSLEYRQVDLPAGSWWPRHGSCSVSASASARLISSSRPRTNG